jgi:folate-binding protein YgfZ
MALFDLSDRTKIRITGGDRLRFLNGQVTNDVRKAGPDVSLPACLVNAKGKIDAFVFISVGTQEFLLDADSELRQVLLQRLDRYVIADDVTLEDVSDQYALFHVLDETNALPNDSSWRRARRFGIAGWDLIVSAVEHDRVRQELAEKQPLCDAACAERLRIEQGVPRSGRELTNEIIPLEANLADAAIDYAKGCYIGQEVLSRMKMSGQVNKRLCGLVSLKGEPLVAGMRLTTTGEEPKDAGWITSAIRSHRLNREIALGFVKRGHNEIGTHLLARGSDNDAIEIAVTGLPFVDHLPAAP